MEILQFSLISCGIFYAIICIFSLLRFFRVYKNQNKVTNVALFFYISMVIAALARGISLYLISSHLDEEKKNDLELFIYLMIIFPDMLNICVYIILIWYYLATFIMAHVNLANDLKLFLKEDNPTIKLKTYIILYIVLFGYLVSFIVLCGLTIVKSIDQSSLYLIDSIFNLASPFIFLVYYLYVICKYSGRPYITDSLKAQVHRIFIIVVTWSLTRILLGVLGLVYSNVLKAIKDEFDKICKDFTYSIMILIFFFVTEFLPDYLALDYQFMMFNIGENDDSRVNSIDEIEKHQILPTNFNSLNPYNTNISDLVSNFSANQRTSLIPKNRTSILKKKEDVFMTKLNLKVSEEVVSSRKNGLGKIYKGFYKDFEIADRVIAFDRLSRYDLEGLSKDIDEIINLEHENICKLFGVCVEDLPNIHIATPYFKKGSLFDVLHTQKVDLSFKEKLSITKKIALGVNYLHANNIVHSHLSSKNILISDKMEPMIIDYGFLNLKKIANVFLKYKNKNSYSSPELLKEPRDITNSNNNSDWTIDTYSFGILLWEIYTGTLPFNVNISTLYNLVVENDFRPEIKDNFHPGVAHIIQLCWDTCKEKRPNFSQILDLLEKINI